MTAPLDKPVRPIDVFCAYCRAAKGVPCFSATGKTRRPHVERRLSAEAAERVRLAVNEGVFS